MPIQTRRYLFLFAAILAGVSLAVASARARSDDEDDLPQQQSRTNATVQRFAYLRVAENTRYGEQSTLMLDFNLRDDAAMKSALFEAFGCPADAWNVFHDRGAESVFSSSCTPRSTSGYLHTRNWINLAPVEKVLAENGTRDFSLRIPLPGAESQLCSPAPSRVTRSRTGADCFYRFDSPTAAPREIRYSYGYTKRGVLQMGLILAAVLLLPVPLTLWMRRTALRAPAEQRAAVTFSYLRYQSLGMLGGLVLWWTAIDLLAADRAASYLLERIPLEGWGGSFFIAWAFLWIPPALIYIVCNALSAPIHRLRGSERTNAEVAWQSAWSAVTIVAPWLFLIAAAVILPRSPRLAVSCFAAWFCVLIFSKRKLARARGIQTHALTTGALRDRVFELAARARVQLQQVYVIRSERMRMANAFAHAKRNILLTDYLLTNLSKREVDAIIGHEVAHLQLGHGQAKRAIYALEIVIYAGLGASLNELLPERFPTGPIAIILMLLLLYFVSRKHEFAADAGSVKINGDAEAMITALAKVSRLNSTPIQWTRTNEPMMTHPSTLRRIAAIAKVGNISAERIPALLSESTAAPRETYELPDTVSAAGKVFSTQFKTAGVSAMAALILVIISLPSALVASIAWKMRLQGTPEWAVLGWGFVLALGLALWIGDFLPFRKHAQLERKIREKLKQEGVAVAAPGGVFVGLAPDASPRLYEGNWSWDVGILALQPNCLTYWGEEARFSLQRAQVSRIYLGPGPANWFNTPSIYITWKTANGTERILNLRAVGVRSSSQMGRETRRMFRDLQNWHFGSAPAIKPLLAIQAADSGKPSLPEPTFGAVSSRYPGAMRTRRGIFRDYIIVGVVAVAVAVICGLRFFPTASLANLQNPNLSGYGLDYSGVAAAWYVVLSAWLIRTAQLVPLWRRRDLRPPRRTAAAAVNPVAARTLSSNP